MLDMYEQGFWPAIHANGDAAVDVALNAIESAQERVGVEAARGIRPQIIHAQVTWPDQLVRMAELGASPTFFTTHVYYWGDLHYERTVGPETAQLNGPYTYPSTGFTHNQVSTYQQLGLF